MCLLHPTTSVTVPESKWRTSENGYHWTVPFAPFHACHGKNRHVLTEIILTSDQDRDRERQKLSPVGVVSPRALANFWRCFDMPS